MREALSAEFKAAVLKYDERPRTRWLTENSVQNTLTVSRLMFTADINAAFDEMEEGNVGALKACTQHNQGCQFDLVCGSEQSLRLGGQSGA